MATFAEKFGVMKRILVLLCALAAFTACHDDEPEPNPQPTTERTVLVYMAGENNLTVTSRGERFLCVDLAEIVEGSKRLTDNQRLLVFVDSLNDARKTDTPVILEVKGGKTTVLHRFSNDFYSCDPARFREVVQYAETNAPARSYGLVLWGHASGWTVSSDSIASARTVTRAYGQDNGTDHGGSLKWMNITQMARALEGLPKLDFIFADCCNMMCAEVGYELRNVTDYLIGSPAEIPGDGAPYTKIVPLLYKNGSELYRGIIDTYYDHYLEEYQNDRELDGCSVPLSVIDMKYISELAQATHDVLGTFADGYPSYPESPDLEGHVFYWYFDSPIMYDMRAFIKRNTTQSVFNTWDRSFKKAVPYYRMSKEWMTIYEDLYYAFTEFTDEVSDDGCVSMFIPVNDFNYYYGTFDYIETFNNFGWNSVVDWSRFGWSSSSIYVRPKRNRAE